MRELSSRSSKRSPAASLTQATFWRVRSGVASAAVSAPPVPSRRLTLMLTMSAWRAAKERTRLPPPPMMSGGPGRCTGSGREGVPEHLVVLAVEVERPVGAQQALDDLDRLLEARHPHRGEVVGEAGLVVVGAHPAGAETQLEAPLAQHVEGGGLLGQHEGVAVVVAEDQRAHAQRGGRGRHRSQRRDRRQLVAEVVGHEQRAVARGPRPGGPGRPRSGPCRRAPCSVARRSGTCGRVPWGHRAPHRARGAPLRSWWAGPGVVCRREGCHTRAVTPFLWTRVVAPSWWATYATSACSPDDVTPSSPWSVRTKTTVPEVIGMGFCGAGSTGYTAWRSVKRPTTPPETTSSAPAGRFAWTARSWAAAGPSTELRMDGRVPARDQLVPEGQALGQRQRQGRRAQHPRRRPPPGRGLSAPVPGPEPGPLRLPGAHPHQHHHGADEDEGHRRHGLERAGRQEPEGPVDVEGHGHQDGDRLEESPRGEQAERPAGRHHAPHRPRLRPQHVEVGGGVGGQRAEHGPARCVRWLVDDPAVVDGDGGATVAVQGGDEDEPRHAERRQPGSVPHAATPAPRTRAERSPATPTKRMDRATTSPKRRPTRAAAQAVR